MGLVITRMATRRKRPLVTDHRGSRSARVSSSCKVLDKWREAPV